jgi:hypothetical protein
MIIPPSFFIVGAPKAGTTALHAYLAAHPQVCMSKVKEPNFFSYDAIAKQKLYYQHKSTTNLNAYLNLFECDKQAKISGEGSVSYLFYECVAEKIKAFNADAKIIISLRNPVARAVSHYQMDFSLGLVPFSFDQIVSNGANHPKSGIYFQQYILLSDYLPQIERYLNVYTQKDVLFILHEELTKNPTSVLEKLSNFLDIHYSPEYTSLEQVNVSGASSNSVIRSLYKSSNFRSISNAVIPKRIKNYLRNSLFSKDSLPVPNAETLAILRERFQKEKSKLEQITGLNLKDWKLEEGV